MSDQSSWPADGTPPPRDAVTVPPAPGAWTPPSAPATAGSSNALKWILGSFFALVILGGGGCAALVIFVASSTTNYVDVANNYLDALRAGDVAEADRLWCAGPAPDIHREVIGASRSQNLTSVAVVNGVGDVLGTLRTENADVSTTVEVRTVDDAACVSDVDAGILFLPR